MRTRRLKPIFDSENPAGVDRGYIHCVSRTVNSEFLFGEREKCRFVSLMRLYEKLCCVRVVTYCVMSNHFHILLEVPKRPEILPDEKWLLDHVRSCYGREREWKLRVEIDQLRQMGGAERISELLNSYYYRMWDVSEFMKTLKQRFTQWFNKIHKRCGTIWESRYRSVLVEGDSLALLATAAYIDLNPLRAGVVDDPADYRWCGYAEALAGQRSAYSGLEILVEILQRYALPKNAKGLLDQYRCVLFERGEARAEGVDGSHKKSRGFSAERVRIEKERGGRLPNMTFLVKKVRYFSRGGIIGSKQFVNLVYEQIREKHDWQKKRIDQVARKMRFGDRIQGREIFALRCVP